jgi:hypothetical protein
VVTNAVEVKPKYRIHFGDDDWRYYQANEKIVRRVLRHAKPHVTKEGYIKTFDPAVVEAMQQMQVVVNSLQAWPAVGQQTN